MLESRICSLFWNTFAMWAGKITFRKHKSDAHCIRKRFKCYVLKVVVHHHASCSTSVCPVLTCFFVSPSCCLSPSSETIDVLGGKTRDGFKQLVCYPPGTVVAVYSVWPGDVQTELTLALSVCRTGTFSVITVILSCNVYDKLNTECLFLCVFARRFRKRDSGLFQ